ncbi:hypothetical protein F8M41_014994 [Gigaspora margarita]|uniref:Uncharacterized protein n=1 Tax=Gigaspora margarita TaxID=4874 RepID=A0A8H3WY23_GIGMA|nr:hypothetical protein F8M41_014994 [Gigaspora margarita]
MTNISSLGPNEWKELGFLKWVSEKDGNELFRVSISFEDRKQRWHNRFKKLLEDVISQYKSLYEDGDYSTITALKSATCLRKTLVCICMIRSGINVVAEQTYKGVQAQDISFVVGGLRDMVDSVWIAVLEIAVTVTKQALVEVWAQDISLVVGGVRDMADPYGITVLETAVKVHLFSRRGVRDMVDPVWDSRPGNCITKQALVEVWARDISLVVGGVRDMVDPINIPKNVSEWWESVENQKRHKDLLEKLIMAQDPLSQIKWAAARNERTRKRFSSAGALGENDDPIVFVISNSSDDYTTDLDSSSEDDDITYSDSVSEEPSQLSMEMKEEMVYAYTKMETQSKWRLSTGKYVEDALFNFAMTANYEHLAHSFIIDPDDETYNLIFTEEELNEFRSYNSKEFPEVPDDLLEYLLKYDKVRFMQVDYKVN